MLYLYILIILTVAGLIYMRFEASMIDVKHVRFTRSQNPLKILQISDIHIEMLKVNPVKIGKLIEREDPDLLIMTGDYVNKSSHVPMFLDFLSQINPDCSIYACLGNHDYGAFRGDDEGLADFIKKLENNGIAVLNNESVCFEKNSKKYNIIGLGDIRHGRDNIKKAFASLCKDGEMNIAFSHNPDIAYKIPRGKIDYLFCGHFHGGQIWAPFDLEFKMLRNERMCKEGIKRGLHKMNGINLYINRGIGNVCVPLRFLSKPEITVFYLP